MGMRKSDTKDINTGRGGTNKEKEGDISEKERNRQTGSRDRLEICRDLVLRADNSIRVCNAIKFGTCLDLDLVMQCTLQLKCSASPPGGGRIQDGWAGPRHL
ncbi:hypothetical protein RRG08_037339 [Elysia crispata]|uniref:Uncharacterized protein n=1 Tax=Elysia crispata TaxID=231223 RepID=A0AAE1AHX9_9GAST|nr:hypothetical protein RRG08_037339 [Elysia crispata]